MPCHDYKCPTCGMVKEVTSSWPDYLMVVTCGECVDHPDMIRLPSAPNFVVNGFNAKNGYTK